jgi:ferredoxin
MTMPEKTPAPTALLRIPLDENRPWKERLSACDGCDRCGDRCVSGYPISRWEYERIRAYLETQDPAEVERIAEGAKEVPWPGAPEFTYEACRFRDVEQGRCSIYPVRPLVCRLFGHVEWLPCPAGIIEEAAPHGVALMEWYGRRDLRPFEEWEIGESGNSETGEREG